ncbi:hypothetical protein AgCh_022439 [Apium graveolens]
MVGARMYGWLYTLVPILILLTPVGLAVDITHFKTVALTLIPSAVKNGAVCLDGSPPAYHIDRGVGDGANNWLVFLEGGGWCDTTEDCLKRTTDKEGLGSSKIMQAKNFTGILGSTQQLNPDFYNWNRVFVRYCDGASFTGNSFDRVNNLSYKGGKVFSAVVKDLLRKGMRHATNALFMGCSAGGLAAILNCDRFRSFLTEHTNVKCASDAGYFLHTKDVLGEYTYANYYKRIVKLHGSNKNLPKACTSTVRPRGLCLFPQNIVPHIETPLFLINAAYDGNQIGRIWAPSVDHLPESWVRCKFDITKCTPDQIDILKGFRLKFLNALPKSSNASFRGMFISSCLNHCQTQDQRNWDTDPGFKVDDKTMAQALGNWFYGRRSVQIIDDDSVPKVCATKLL